MAKGKQQTKANKKRKRWMGLNRDMYCFMQAPVPYSVYEYSDNDNSSDKIGSSKNRRLPIAKRAVPTISLIIGSNFFNACHNTYIIT